MSCTKQVNKQDAAKNNVHTAQPLQWQIPGLHMLTQKSPKKVKPMEIDTTYFYKPNTQITMSRLQQQT